MLTGPDVHVEQSINRVSIPTRNLYLLKASKPTVGPNQSLVCITSENGPADRISECLPTPNGTEIKNKRARRLPLLHHKPLWPVLAHL
jgi:hypothetical protein